MKKSFTALFMLLLVLGCFSANVVFADQVAVSQEAQKVKQDRKQLKQDKKALKAAKKAARKAKRAARKQQKQGTSEATPAPVQTNQ